MADKNIFRDNFQAVQVHLEITQSVIQRMASNSSSCKAWCITLVSAILVIVADKEESRFALVALIPVLLFFVLDIYYLALEKLFRNSFNLFMDKLHSKGISSKDLYVVTPKGNKLKAYFRSLTSFAIWPFYTTLLVMILIVMKYVF